MHAVFKLRCHSFIAVARGSSSYQSFPRYLDEVVGQTWIFFAQSIGSHAI